MITTTRSVLSQTEWPAITAENKPWTRWWWPGNAVDTANLGVLLETYAKAGLGGLEVVPIYGVRGYEDQFLPYLGTTWMKALKFTLKKAEELNMGIDMANGTGWPFGGNWVSAADASHYLAFMSYDLQDGDSLADKLLYSADYSRTVARYSKTVDQIRKSDNIKPFRVMAYDNSGNAADLTSLVDDKGSLNWTAPQGKWKIIALFSANHGKMVERAAPGAEGYAIDHFSESSLNNYLQHFDSAFTGHNISGLRCMFNDSYEVDDAFGQADWTPSLPDEFIRRRGYDLLQYMPALLTKDTSSLCRRVIYDYRLTISELILEKFTLPWRKWTNGRGFITRNQAHGSPGNILDLYAISDIPETEGNDIMRFKFASSAGNINSKRLISAEAATWLNDHFISTLADVKKAADNYFLGGVNHLIYHGTAYSPVTDPWPGWLFYAAVHFQPSNPLWECFSALNDYIARTQSFLQQGSADNDILLYYPVADRFSDRGEHLLRHFDHMEREFQGTGFQSCASQLHEIGYTFDFISDRQLQHVSVQNGTIRTGTASYKAIVIPGCRYMPIETWQQVFEMVKEGATVFFYNTIPCEVPGLKSYEVHQPEFDRLKQSLRFSEVEGHVQQARYGEGLYFLSSDLTSMLRHSGIRNETLTDYQLQYVRRKIGSNTLYFICNTGQSEFDGWLPLNCNAVSAWLFDAYTGIKGKAAVRGQTGNLEIYMRLKPSATILVMAYTEEVSGEPFPFYDPAGQSLAIGNSWNVEFLSGGPVIPPPLQVSSLTSWTEWGDEAKAFSGLVRYTSAFRKPSQNARFYILNLGRIHDCAKVYINGNLSATLIGEDFSLMVDASSLKKKNVLEIVVANRMANRIADMDKKGIVYKKFYNVNFPANRRENVGSDGLFSAASWNPIPSGLLGPVTLTPAVLNEF